MELFSKTGIIKIHSDVLFPYIISFSNILIWITIANSEESGLRLTASISVGLAHFHAYYLAYKKL